MTTRLIKKPVLVVILAVCLLLILVVVVGLSISRFAKESDRLTRKLHVDFSSKTTLFSGPVRKDGTIDYITALNTHLSQGVTDENNAFRDLALILRPDATPQHQAAMQQVLNIDIQELNESPIFWRWVGENHPPSSAFSPIKQSDLTLDELLADPYTKDATPLLEEWVQTNEEALDFGLSSLTKKHYWIPIVHEPGDDELLLVVWTTYADLIREMGNCYRARLLLAARDRNTGVAIRSLQAILRLAQLQSNDPNLIGSLSAISIKTRAISALQMILEHQFLDNKSLDQLAEIWTPLDGCVPIVRSIDLWERHVALDALMQVASGRSSMARILSGEFEQVPIDHLYVDQRFDIHLAVDMIQSQFDLIVAMFNEIDYRKFAQQANDFEKELEKRGKQSSKIIFVDHNGKTILNSEMQNPAHTEHLTHWYLSIMMPALVAARRTELRMTAMYRSAHVAIAVERYRMDHNQLPESLENLVPVYLGKVPDDPFDNLPIRYRITDSGYVVYSVGTNLQDDAGLHDHAEGDTAFVVNWIKY